MLRGGRTSGFNTIAGGEQYDLHNGHWEQQQHLHEQHLGHQRALPHLGHWPELQPKHHDEHHRHRRGKQPALPQQHLPPPLHHHYLHPLPLLLEKMHQPHLTRASIPIQTTTTKNLHTVERMIGRRQASSTLQEIFSCVCPTSVFLKTKSSVVKTEFPT
ncbi:hypothetical protein scyTo_0012325 [Scyliorhinus torazame]|uniref:Uncharacterized protein n=1 Tax=Scyliorhinus torazame TaxID=75743 RepID=A0A401P6S6_SCYTO|nr:hypothetical protein [Scyliorhinus torazame]